MRKQNQVNHGRISMNVSETAGDIERIKSARVKTVKYKQGNKLIVVLGVVLVLVFMFSVSLFSTATKDVQSLSYMLELSKSHANDFFHFITGQGAVNNVQYTFYRYIVVVIAGACLAASGAVYQGAFKNMLASPSTLGVQSGGNLGNIVYVMLFVNVGAETVRYDELVERAQAMNLFQKNMQQFCVLIGCFLAVGIVVGITLMLGRGKLQSRNLILTGMIFSSLIGNVSTIVSYYLIMNNSEDPRIDMIRQISMGNFENVFTIQQIAVICLFLVPTMTILILIAPKLDVLALGEAEAKTMGLNANVFKNTIIALNTVITAVIIAFCGRVGFVGFMIPLAARKLVGPAFRRLLPASMMMGATMLIIIYDVARWFNLTGYMNLLTSALGSIVMIYSLIKGGGVTRAD